METPQLDKHLKYVSPEYQARLERLAEILIQPRQLRLFDNVVELLPVAETPPEAA